MYLIQGVSRIHKELSKLDNGEINNPIKQWTTFWTDTSKKMNVNKHIKKNHQEAQIKTI